MTRAERLKKAVRHSGVTADSIILDFEEVDERKIQDLSGNGNYCELIYDYLINYDIIIGENDRANLEEANSDNPSVENFKKNHKLMRKANEGRASSKNKIDEQFKKSIEE